MDIIQFVPYYPPHVGGLEKVAQDIHENWSFGKSFVVTGYIGTHDREREENILVYPACDLVSNFPIPKFWKKEFWKVLKQLKGELTEDTRIITHTRFFLSSFLGARFAKLYKMRHVHIEHGSGYVLTGKKGVDFFAKLYDISLGKITLQCAQKIVCISAASKYFLENSFCMKDAGVWYRGFLLSNTEDSIEKTGEVQFVYVGRISSLKRVGDICEAYKKGDFQQKLTIIGEGEESEKLEKIYGPENIIFAGAWHHKKLIDFLQTHKCIVINPSGQEGLPSTVIEGLLTKNIVIATDVGGTAEITDKEDLFLYEPGDVAKLKKYMEDALLKYNNLQSKSYMSVKEQFSMQKSIENLYNEIV